MLAKFIALFLCLLFAIISTKSETLTACRLREEAMNRTWEEEKQFILQMFRDTEMELRTTLDLAQAYKEQTKRDIALLKLVLNSTTNEELLALEGRCAKASAIDLTKLSNGKLYLFEQEKRTWYAANAFCEERGLKLATIKNAVELNILHRKLRILSIDEPAWLSGSNAKQEYGHFIWQDGSVMDTNSTLLDKENRAVDNDEESCLFIYKGFEPYLYHAKCNRESAFICERPTICEHISNRSITVDN